LDRSLFPHGFQQEDTRWLGNCHPKTIDQKDISREVGHVEGIEIERDISPSQDPHGLVGEDDTIEVISLYTLCPLPIGR
jgi:hypothetical protein